MIGDGNCLFRALSTCLHGHQLNYMAPRVSIAQYLSQPAEAAAPEDRFIFCQHAANIACNGVWAGDDIFVGSSKLSAT